MPENNEPRKVNLADAIKQKLEQKKQQNTSANKPGQFQAGSAQKMKSQNNKNQTTSVVVPAVRKEPIRNARQKMLHLPYPGGAAFLLNKKAG